MSLERKTSNTLKDSQQSFWQLAAIQLTGVTSLPVLFSSVLLIQKNTFINSVIILLFANIFLWIIRYGLIKMSFKGRKSVMDIAEEFLGNAWGFRNSGVYSIALLLLLSTLFLFIEETTIVCKAITQIFSIREGFGIDPYMQISVLIGISSTIFCTWGIISLKHLSVVSLPIILISFMILVILSPSNIYLFESHAAFSLVGLSRVLAINLAVTADLPTFFRHSKSWKSSLQALVMIQVISFILGIGGLFLGKILQPTAESPVFINIVKTSLSLQISFVVLVFLSSVCTNVSNVYSSSVGWETFFKKSLIGVKEYLILGFLMTLGFLIMTGIISMEYFVSIASDSLVNMSIVFLFGYLIYLSKRKPFTPGEKSSFFLAWLFSTLVTVFLYSNLFLPKISPLLASITSIFFILIIQQAFQLLFIDKNPRFKV